MTKDMKLNITKIIGLIFNKNEGDEEHKKIDNILFLDFDGVLHPGLSETFVYLPLLENLLRQHPHVNIVISSSWRETCEFAYLKRIFSEDMRNRVVGITTSMNGLFTREIEIRAYVEANKTTNFVVLDDDESLFSPTFNKLIKTRKNEGLRESHLNKLDDAFNSWI